MWLSQTVNAILLPLLLVLILKISNDKEVLGDQVNRKWQNIFAIGLTVMISAITVALFLYT
jgi:Mn2+/Fe2+ NRAMP family transporter